jgi:hypothetical protein
MRTIRFIGKRLEGRGLRLEGRGLRLEGRGLRVDGVPSGQVKEQT